MEPPVGTVTMLFTDIEGSTSLVHELGQGWGEVLVEHHRLLGEAIDVHGGYVDGTEGDAFFAVFSDARAGLAAAMQAQRALREHTWPTSSGALKVRMGLHTGYVERQATGYVGLEVHRAARVASAAHGGQILLTGAALSLAGAEVATTDLGLHRLKDFPAPEPLHCVGARASFPPPRTLGVRPTNLPADNRPFLGRDADLAAVAAAFDEGESLVTLTGIGGTGKTRLALAAAAELLDSHAGGVWWVPLASETDAAAIMTRLAAALKVDAQGASSPFDALAHRLGASRALVVLDNLEQIPGASDVVSSLLAVAPGLRVLATSQAPLRLTTERVIALEPLSPGAARELLTSVAARVRPGLLVPTDLADALCERLDRLPLAIELAAGRMSVLSPEQVLERLDAPLRLLKSGDRDRPERHRSLRATIDWTLGLLDEEPRALFTRLGAFAGAVELEDIEAVCEDDDVDVLEAVAGLLDVGILRRRENGVGGVRLRLPEALRQVARDELDASRASEKWRRAHAEHMTQAALDAGLPLASTAAASARARALDAEMRLALEWAWEHDPVLAAGLAGPVAMCWTQDGGPTEGLGLADRAFAVPDLPVRVRAYGLLARGYARGILNDADGALDLCAAVCDLVGEEDEVHRYALGMRGWTLSMRAEDGREIATAALSLARRHGGLPEVACMLVLSFITHLGAGEPDAAAAYLDEAELLVEASDAATRSMITTCRGDAALARGDAATAAVAYLRSLTAAQERSDLLQVFFDLCGLAASLSVASQDVDALEVMGMAEALAAQTGIDAGAGLPGYEQLQAARERAGADMAEDALARGRAVGISGCVARARTLSAQALAAV